MIVEAAKEGAQSLPSRVSEAQRINEGSVARSDILAVSDDSSEDEVTAAEFKSISKSSIKQNKMLLPPQSVPVERERMGHTPLMIGLGKKAQYNYSTHDKYQPSEVVKRPINDRLSMSLLEDIPQDVPNYVQLREDCAAAGLPSIEDNLSLFRPNILQQASKFSAANHTYGRVIENITMQSPPKVPQPARLIEPKASVPGAHKTKRFSAAHVMPLRVLPRICTSAPVTAHGNNNQPMLLLPLRTKAGIQMRDISYDRVAAASAAAASAAERAQELMAASQQRKLEHFASPERLAEILQHRRERLAEQMKATISVEAVAMEDDAEDEPETTPRPAEQADEQNESVNVDMLLSASDAAVHQELVAAGGAEGTAEDALKATMAGEMERLDFFHAARAAYNEQPKTAITRDLLDKKRYSGSGFEDIASTPQAALIDLASTLAQKRLPPRPAILHSDKSPDGKLLRWQYFGYGAEFANAHSEAMGALGFSGFNFTECRLGTTGLRDIMPAITANLQQLTQLDLTSNNLRDEGAKILAHSLSGYDPTVGPGCRAVQNLRELILSHNGIGDEGAKVLSDNLFFVPSLSVLMLDNNLIGGDGAKYLAKLVRESEALTSLNLAWNKIRGPGAAEFGAAFAFNNSISTLNIAWNSFGKAGVAPLANCLVENSTLKHLHLTHNGLSDVPVILLCYAMRRNHCIETLMLDGNPIGRKGFNAVQRMIRLDESGTLRIGTEGCAIDAPSEIPNFSIKRPDGFWRLDFSLPEHRAIASELWEVAVKQRGENWIGETLDGLEMNISEDPRYPWIIPTKGVMEVDFVSCPDPPMADDVVKGPIIQRMLALMAASASEKEKQGIVSSAAFEEIFVSSQVAELLLSIEDMGERLSACIALFSKVVDLENKMLFVQQLGPSEQNLLPTYVGALYYFNPLFPTGHYKLRMEDDNDLALMTRLRQIAFDEKKNRRFNNLPDLSQWGNEDGCFRNVQRDGNLQEPSNITKGGQLPAKGEFLASAFTSVTSSDPCSQSNYRHI
jgi:Leucine-rich repeat (LRR) protein